jgi:asparagine synthase (glutamine-hydrolysing)
MSAIAAVIHWDSRPVKQALLESVNDCVRYRCPDGSWVWVNGSVGMTQADLATLPEDEPGIPVVSGKLRIAASCRIDNRGEVRCALPREFLPKSGTDAALILSAYQAWGDACVARLIGDFAFIIWDSDRQEIFAARDISGARQLYYYCSQEKLFIASERTQILQDPTVPLEVDEEQLIEYLTPSYQWYSGWDQGLFRGFQALPAGYMLRAERGNVTVRPFWEWEDRAPDHRSEKQVIEEYLETLKEAVCCRLRSRSPVAIELSGGLDSSAVTCLAARFSNGSSPELHTLSMVFDEVPEVDERHRIQKVLDRYPLSSHFMVADRLYAPQCFSPDWSPRSVMGPHEIMTAPAIVHLYDLAEQAGCRVVLTGHMGDALNDGCERVYFDLLQRGRYRETLRRFQIDWKRSRKKALRGLLFDGLVPIAPLPLLRAGLLAWERRKGMVCELPEYFTLSLHKRIREVDEAIRMQREKQTRVSSPAVRWTLRTCFPPMIVQTMPFPQPLERRHPYTDRRLVERVLSMPQELKWEHEERGSLRAGRFHHRKAMVGILPDEVRIGNIGVDFSPAIRLCLSPAAMRDWLKRDSVVHIFERGYVLPDMFLDELASSTKPNGYLMTMLSVEGWLRAIAPGGEMHRLIPKRSAPA